MAASIMGMAIATARAAASRSAYIARHSVRLAIRVPEWRVARSLRTPRPGNDRCRGSVADRLLAWGWGCCPAGRACDRAVALRPDFLADPARGRSAWGYACAGLPPAWDVGCRSSLAPRGSV